YLLGVLAGLFLSLAKAGMLAQVAVSILISGDGHANAGNQQTVRLARRVLRNDRKNHLSGTQVFEAFLAWNQPAVGRKDGGNAHQIMRGDPRIPKGQLKGAQTVLVFAYALGEKHFLRDHAFS